MLDDAILAQLRDVFARLENPVTLRYDASEHPGQGELAVLLADLAAVSPLIVPAPSDVASPHLRFRLETGGHATGVGSVASSFCGAEDTRS